MTIEFTLVADGSSDRSLLRVAEWTFRQHLGNSTPILGNFAELGFLRKPPRGLADRMARAVDLYPCSILLVHRDSEGHEPEDRYREIRDAFAAARLQCRYLCIIPVRMTEAWLLFDEGAIRKAAGNPKGQTRLKLPEIAKCEELTDPKRLLREILMNASELSGRRRNSFRADVAAAQLATIIEDYSPLRALAAFQRFEQDVRKIAPLLAPDA